MKKSLYGIRQTLWCWFFKFTTAFRACGFRQSYADYSLFTFTSTCVFLCVLIYADDLLITENFEHSIDKFKNYLGTYFCMKDLGPLKYFLGIEVAHSSKGTYVKENIYWRIFLKLVYLVPNQLLQLWSQIIS